MTARKNKNTKDAIEAILGQIDFHGMIKDEFTGQNGLLRYITKRFYERVLQAEIDEHLGYVKNDNAGDNSGNSRNGYTEKSLILDDNSRVVIQVPRDRNSTFRPLIIPKHQKHAPLFSDQIISMYSGGMSSLDMQRRLENVYEIDVSPELIFRVIQYVMEDVRQWQSRPLGNSYPILFFDELQLNLRQGDKSVSQVLYGVLAINWDGEKDILGVWRADTEGAPFWMSVLTDIKNRGMKDPLIACMDGLTNIPDAVRAVFPNAHIQHYVVNMNRSSTKGGALKDLKQVCRDLKIIE
ncbi:MAG: IS256 family transposase [Treponema sp.]|uniref:IS256 family transposase n=1 Tax=Treponema sp. TaxID=166 RepID=UPI003FA28642